MQQWRQMENVGIATKEDEIAQSKSINPQF